MSDARMPSDPDEGSDAGSVTRTFLSGTERGHAPAIVLLSMAAFFAVAMSRACDPLVPEIARSFDVSIARATAPVTAFVVAYGLGQLLYGPVGSRIGTYRTATISCTLATAFSMACAFAVSLEQLIVARVFAGFAAGAVLPMSIAFIGETVPYEDRQGTLARFITGAILGSIAGFALSGALAQFVEWRFMFASLSIGFAAVSVGLWCYLPRLPRPVRPRAHKILGPHRQYARILRQPWPLTVLVLVASGGFFVFGVVPYVAVLLARDHGLDSLGIGAVLGCLGVGALCYAFTARQVIRRLGELGCARLGGVIIMLGYGVIAIAPSQPLVALGAFAVGGGYMMLQNTFQTNATQMVPDDQSGAVSLFGFFLYVGQAAGVAVLAMITPVIGYRPVIIACGIAALVVGFVFAAAKARQPVTSAGQGAT